jgi:hypothetical protein
MVNVLSARCVEEGCRKTAIFGVRSSKVSNVHTAVVSITVHSVLHLKLTLLALRCAASAGQALLQGACCWQSWCGEQRRCSQLH